MGVMSLAVPIYLGLLEDGFNLGSFLRVAAFTAKGRMHQGACQHRDRRSLTILSDGQNGVGVLQSRYTASLANLPGLLSISSTTNVAQLAADGLVTTMQRTGWR